MVLRTVRRLRQSGSAVLVAALSALLVVGCDPPPPDQQAMGAGSAASEAQDTATGSVPLKAIMAGLASDMAAVAMGLWLEDGPTVADASGRVADHPRVGPEQMSAIQATLGDEFPEFATFDRLVHDKAVDLRERALAERPMAELTEIYAGIVDGCVQCHTAFRGRLIEALGPGLGIQ